MRVIYCSRTPREPFLLLLVQASLCKCLKESRSTLLQNTKGEVVEELGELLNKAGMQNVLPLPKARVPVVKFVVGDNGTKVRALWQCTAVLFGCPCMLDPSDMLGAGYLPWDIF